MTSATGAIYMVRLLERLAELGHEIHLVYGIWASADLKQETRYELNHIKRLAARVYSDADRLAAIASASSHFDRGAITPRSMKTLVNIRSVHAKNLNSRIAYVVFKIPRNLLWMFRDTQLNVIHLENIPNVEKEREVV